MLLTSQFTTFRTSQDPHAIVHAVVADRTHWVNVAFDPDVTEKHERLVVFILPTTLLTIQLHRRRGT